MRLIYVIDYITLRDERGEDYPIRTYRLKKIRSPNDKYVHMQIQRRKISSERVHEEREYRKTEVL